MSVYTPLMGITDLLLQKGERDLTSERGVSCDGELPAASDPQLVERASGGDFHFVNGIGT